MILSLEVLQANEGDCLILHYGRESAPQFVVIDGGPAGIYRKYLKPRLIKIGSKFFRDETLPLAMLMVSHADDDHINGIVSLTNELVQQRKDGEKPLFSINRFWFNSFDDIVGNIQIPVVSAISSSVAAATKEFSMHETFNGAEEHMTALIASTGQGRTIRDNVKALGINLNAPFEPLPHSDVSLVRGDTPNSKYKLMDGFTIQVIHPNQQRLLELQKQWDEDLKKSKAAGDNSIILSALLNDKSPFNLSSIVCLIEHGNKKILITGDSRADDILNGLAANHLLDTAGNLHVDILKMPHHGSKANMNLEFLQRVTADHYVISADGKHSNPDQPVLDMFEKAVKSGTLHLTNHEGKLDLKAKLDAFIQKLANSGSALKVSFPANGKNSRIIDLLAAVTY